MAKSSFKWHKGNKLYHNSTYLFTLTRDNPKDDYILEYPDGHRGVTSMGNNYLTAMDKAMSLAKESYECP